MKPESYQWIINLMQFANLPFASAHELARAIRAHDLGAIEHLLTVNT